MSLSKIGYCLVFFTTNDFIRKIIVIWRLKYNTNIYIANTDTLIIHSENNLAIFALYIFSFIVSVNKLLKNNGLQFL